MNAIDVVSEPDLFAVACPRCAAALAVGDDLVGGLAGCPVCQTTFLVPEPELPPSPAQPALTAAATAADPVWREMTPALAEAAAQPTERNRDLEFREPVRTLQTKDGMLELRRLSDEEKQLRRGRRNIIMLLVGTTILIVLTLLLGREPTKKPR
ncbi:MAG: hypothetical protein WCC69_06220 [Pirellulales bacterium]